MADPNRFPATYLRIDGVAILDRYAPDITQTMEWVNHGEVLPFEDGSTFSTHRPIQRRRRTTISGEGDRKPAFDNIFPGDEKMIDWAKHFDLTGDFPIDQLEFEPSAGSLRYLGEAGGTSTRLATPVLLQHGDAGVLVTYYRPRMLMKLLDASVSEATKNARVSWSMTWEQSYSKGYMDAQA